MSEMYFTVQPSIVLKYKIPINAIVSRHYSFLLSSVQTQHTGFYSGNKVRAQHFYFLSI